MGNNSMKATVSIQVTGDCNLACTYCYQHSKNNKMLDIAKAHKLIDAIITNDQSFFQGYIDFDAAPRIIIDYIGGEPFVNYKAVIDCCDYYKAACEKFNKPEMFEKVFFSIGTNGTIFNDEIADLLERYKGRIGVSITIDGCKVLHDACRRFKGTNEPSYDIVIANFQKFKQHVCPKMGLDNTKITLSPDNIDYLVQSVKNMYEDLGFTKVPANCVFEKVWCIDDAKKLYRYLKEIADYFLDKDWEFEDFDFSSEKPVTKRQFGFFSEHFFTKETDMKSAWCGGNGRMLFLQYDGKIYNCVRYSETSINNPERDLFIGDIERGVYRKDVINFMRSAVRENIMDDECKQCPVAKGCADCLAYNYEISGTFKKPKSLCDMHKARSLANVYFWNKYYMAHNIPKVMLINLPLKEALNYIDEEELNMLLEISNSRYIKSLKGDKNETH